MSHLRCHVPLRSTEPAQIGNSAVLSRVRGLCSEHDVIGSSVGFRSGTRGLQDQSPDRTGPLFLPISRSRGPVLRERRGRASAAAIDKLATALWTFLYVAIGDVKLVFQDSDPAPENWTA